MSMYKVGNQRIDGLIPGTRGERAFPSDELRYESNNTLGGTDPFIMLDHIGPSKMATDWRLSGDQGIHPHRGFETITFMFKGNLHHLDTVFTERPLLTDWSVQHMNTGKGIRHGGDFWADDMSAEFHEVQLWVNSPAHKKMSDPYVRNYAAENIPNLVVNNIQLRVIAGLYNGHTGPVDTYADICVLHGTITQPINNDITSIVTLKKQHKSQFLFVMTGDIQVNGEQVNAGETQVLKALEQITIEGSIASQFLLMSGVPLHQPFVAVGPFVMNTHEQIKQAFDDVESGVF
jgi:redox-sensitive bicupin YhaK (pirin superfamily)